MALLTWYFFTRIYMHNCLKMLILLLLIWLRCFQMEFMIPNIYLIMSVGNQHHFLSTSSEPSKYISNLFLIHTRNHTGRLFYLMPSVNRDIVGIIRFCEKLRSWYFTKIRRISSFKLSFICFIKHEAMPTMLT